MAVDGDHVSCAAPPHGLYWSKDGSVACALHAPAPDSAAWRVRGWVIVPAWRRSFHGVRLQCQFCFGRPYGNAREARRSEAAAHAGPAAADVPALVRSRKS